MYASHFFKYYFFYKSGFNGRRRENYDKDAIQNINRCAHFFARYET